LRGGQNAAQLVGDAISYIDIPYKNKYWRGTKFGELANCHAIAKFKSHQYFFYSVSIVTLVAFE